MTTTQIAALNDVLQKTFAGGKVMFTKAFTELPTATQADVMLKVRAFNDFTEGNDPHGEHEFGAVEVADEKFFWKIDYYDKSMEYGSEDPADPKVTTRVLTIMLASDY